MAEREQKKKQAPAKADEDVAKPAKTAFDKSMKELKLD